MCAVHERRTLPVVESVYTLPFACHWDTSLDGPFVSKSRRSFVGLVVDRSHFQIADALATLVLTLVFIEEVGFRFSTAYW